MDGQGFDAWARRLGARFDRRGVLRGLLGGAVSVAAAGVLLDADDAAAVCGGTGARCNRDSACCSGACAWSTVSRGGRRTRVGACAPPPGPSTCDTVGSAVACVTTRSGVLQFCLEPAGTILGSLNCVSDAACQGYSPDCGTTLTCACSTGSAYAGLGYGTFTPLCLGFATANLCSQ